jgi:hypothetical protein
VPENWPVLGPFGLVFSHFRPKTAKYDILPFFFRVRYPTLVIRATNQRTVWLSGQMSGSIVPDLVNIDLKHKDITLPAWNLGLGSPAWLFR